MSESANLPNPLVQVVKSDPRYSIHAYLFLYEALRHTVKMLGLDKKPRLPKEQRHVSGAQLLDGIRQLAHRQFGFLAKTVFESWGVRRTDDWGEIVFTLVEHGLMHKRATDRREDFHAVYDFTEALEVAYFRDGLYRGDSDEDKDQVHAESAKSDDMEAEEF